MQIDKNSFVGELTRVFTLNGLAGLLSAKKSEALYLLTERMLEENEKYNLTAITDPKKIIISHYADSALLASRLPKNAKIADIGCGAGFPSLPIAILREDISVTAIDSTQKRVNYVAESASILGLSNLRAVAMRAEDGGQSPEYREKFDVVTARAVAELRILAELCLPYARVGGSFMAMKGKNAKAEFDAAKRALAILGAREVRCTELTLLGDDEPLARPLIIAEKREKCPRDYPRPYAKISKKPL